MHLSQLVGRLKSRFLGDAGWIFAGQVVPKLLGLGLIAVWTRYLTPTDYGIFGLITSVSGFLLPLTMLGMHAAVNRRYFDGDRQDDDFKRYFTSVANAMLLLGVLSAGVLMACGPFLWRGEYAAAVAFFPFIVLPVIAVAGEGFGELYRNFFVVQRRGRLNALIGLSRYFVGLAISLPLVCALEFGVRGRIIGTFVATIGGLAAVLVAGRGLYQGLVLEWAHVRSALAFGLPFVPHLLSHWAMNLGDRIVIGLYCPLDELGYYSLASNLISPLTFLITSLSMVLVPRYYAWRKNGAQAAHAKLAKYFSVWATVIPLAAVAGSLVAFPVVELLATSRYLHAVPYVPYLALAQVFLGAYLFGMLTFGYFKKNRLVPVLSGLAALVNLALNFVLVPRMGATGAALATLIAYLLLAVLFHLAAGRIERIPVNLVRLTGVTALGGAGVAVSYAHSHDLVVSVVVGSVFLAVLAGVYWMSDRRTGTEPSHP